MENELCNFNDLLNIVRIFILYFNISFWIFKVFKFVVKVYVVLDNVFCDGNDING